MTETAKPALRASSEGTATEDAKKGLSPSPPEKRSWAKRSAASKAGWRTKKAMQAARKASDAKAKAAEADRT